MARTYRNNGPYITSDREGMYAAERLAFKSAHRTIVRSARRFASQAIRKGSWDQLTTTDLYTRKTLSGARFHVL